MSTPFDALEHQLSSLRPARLPGPTRQLVLDKMKRTAATHGSLLWLFGHRPSFQVALAGALSVALVVGSTRLSRSSRPASRVNQAAFAVSNGLLPSLDFWETKLASASPMGANTVAVLWSPSTLTNIQIRH
jgi:hypothetical protein